MLIQGKDYKVIITRKKVKNISVRVKNDGIIYVTCRKRDSDATIYEFLNRANDFLIKAINKIEKNQDGTILFKGNKYIYIPSNKIGLEIGPDNQGYIYLPSMDKQYIHQFLNKHTSYLEELFYETIKELNISNVTLKMRFMTSVWGTCNRKTRVINLNKYLIQLKPEIVKSVIYHELAHLYVANHGQDFYRQLNMFDPFFKEHRKELNKVSFILK